MEPITLEINGQPVTATPGRTILEVVHDQRLDEIPTLCHSPELAPYGSCFVCVVEVEGRPSLVPACATRIAPGMKVHTRNDRVVASRRTALELLLSNHYADCASPCQLGCPAGVDAQGYLALSAMGLFRQAVDLVRETNPLPAVCGRICVRKCEAVCRRADIDEPVGINFVKRFITDAPGAYDGTPTREPSRGRSVGIVGAGPAGLTAAWFLGRRGYDPVLYEAHHNPGGMLRYGIPEYRLPKDVLDKEIEFICRAGARIECGVRIGRDITLTELRRRHDAVFVAAGAMGGSPMRIEGENETEGVELGTDFLLRSAQSPQPVSGTVVVVGGGNTAMDVARTAWRLGADKVIILYRRTKAEMPADPMEIEDCIKEGIEIFELAAPVATVAVNGRLRALRCIRMMLGEPDASGRRRPVPREGSEFELPCQLAVAAIGQKPILDDLIGNSPDDPRLTKWGTLVIDPHTLATNVAGVFAGGDVADDGPTVVIDAIRDGQRAARAIHAYLSGEPIPADPFEVRKEFWAKPGQTELGDIAQSPRRPMPDLHVEERAGSFQEVATGYEYEDMAHEAHRCLSCGCLAFDDCSLRRYAEQYGVNMVRYQGYARRHRVDDRHPHLVYDPNKCILCARCIRTCARILPISALGLVNRGFQTEMRPAMNDPLVQTNCISCGACVDSCPTGALTDKLPFPGRAHLVKDKGDSRCGMCAVGCELTVHRLSDTRYHVTAPNVPGAVLCRHGRYGTEWFIQSRRLTAPQIRENGRQVPVAFTHAFGQIAAGLRQAIRHHGPESVAVLVSPELTSEQMYLAARIAREALGTNNIASLSVLARQRAAGPLDGSLGFTQSTAGREALGEADLIVLNNADPENEFPVLNVDLIAAARRGAKLISCHSTTVSTDALATLCLDPLRGRSALLWNGVIQQLLERGIPSRKTVRRLPGGVEFLADKFDYGTPAIATVTGVEIARIAAAADLLAGARRVVFLHGLDRPQDISPGGLATLANLILLLRAAHIEADLLLPTSAANRSGLELAGADPAFLPGRQPVLSPLPGATDHAAMRELLAAGRLRAALIIGEDPGRDDRTASYFRNLEFLAAMDWTRTETTDMADVTLPGATPLEEEGTRCNFEGRLLHFRPAIQPPSGQPGWRILSGLANAFGLADLPAGISDLTARLTRLVETGTGPWLPFYWHTAGERQWDGRGTLVVADVSAQPGPVPPDLTALEYRKRGNR